MNDRTFKIEKKFCTYTIEECTTEDGMFITGYQLKDYTIREDLKGYVYPPYPFISTFTNTEWYIEEFEDKLERLSVMVPYLTNMENYGYYGENPGIPESDLEDLVDDLYKLIHKPVDNT